MLSSRMHVLLLATSIFAIGGGAVAQEAAAVEEVVVTGSRITSPGFTAPTPVTSVTAEDIQTQAVRQANQLQYTIPQLVPNVSSQGTGPAGHSTLNLRGLGSLRTLVLLDGRRLPPTSYDGTIDANIIPTSLVRRVDVVTGGASAAYGSDAVAGVVNFVLDTTFQGIKGSLSGGQSHYKDFDELDFTLTGGTAFAGGRGHIVASVELFRNSGSNGNLERTGGVARRPWASQGWALIPGGTGFPAQISRPNVKFSNMTNGGLITSGPLRGIMFNPGGTISNMVYGTNLSATYMVGGSGDEAQLYGSPAPELKRQSAFLNASYDLTDNVSIWGQVLAIHNESWSPNVMNYDNNTLVIRSDNAFLPANVRALMAANNLTSFTFGRIDRELGLGASRGFVDDVLYSVGVKGKAFGDWNWDVSGQFNDNEWDFVYENQRNNALWALGIDTVANPATGGVPGVAVGAPVCRSTLTNPTNGCVAINLFGEGSITPAMYNYVHGESHNNVPSETWNVAANMSGVLLQNWAGDVNVATGVEARRTWLAGTADAVSLARQWRGGNILPFKAHNRVIEGYVEADVPLLNDAPFAQELGLNMAGRWTNYDTFGSVQTWKIGLSNQVNDSLRARIAYSRDIRAPTLNDLAAASGSSSGQFFNNRTGQTQTLTTTTGGNPDLQPEKANTLTAGVVYSPEFIPGFTAVLDYYNITVKDGIQTTTAQQFVDSCQIFNIQEACALITFNSAGLVTAISVKPLNVASLKMDGIDAEMTYRFPGDALWDKLTGNFRLRAVATYVNKITSTTVGGVTVDSLGQYQTAGAGISGSIPQIVLVGNLGYSTDKWNFQVDYRYTDKLVFNNTYVEGRDIDNNNIPGRQYFNASLQYNIDDHWEVFGRVANIFNRAPPVNPTNNLIVPTTSSSQTFDRVGRAWNVGVRFEY